MFVVLIILVMFVLPAAYVLNDIIILKADNELMFLIGKWFVFWGVGIRLFTAGIRQVFQPQFTARDILGIADNKSYVVIRELGFANISIGLLGILSLLNSVWILPSAIVGGSFYALATLQHFLRKRKKITEKVVTISDLFMFLVLFGYIGSELF